MKPDFIVLASDGIYDKLSVEDVGKAVWMTCETTKQHAKLGNSSVSVHQFSGLGVEAILKNSLMRQSLDNVTVVMVAFENFKKTLCSDSSTIIPPTTPVIHRNSSNENKF